MAETTDPISALANGVGAIFQSVSSVWTAKEQTKAVKAQAAAQKYMAGQMTEQQYLAFLQSQEEGLTGLTSQVYGTKNQVNYLPMVAVAGLFIVLAILIFKKSKA